MPDTLINATPVPEVLFKDGHTETVNLGELSLVELYVFIKHLASRDTPQLVAFCANQPLAWVNTLSDAGFQKLAKKASELNFSRAATMMESDPIAAAQLTPLMAEIYEADVIAKKKLLTIEPKPETNGSSGKSASSSPAPLVSATAIGTESSASLLDASSG